MAAENIPVAPGTNPSPRPKLGNLAEAQHKKHLRGAKIAIFFVGVLSVGFNAFVFHMISENESKLEADIASLQRNPTMVVDESKVQEARGQIASARMLTTGFLLAGVAILVLGFLVNAHPYKAPMIALAIYIVCLLIGMAVDPTSIAKGIVIKLIIIYALYRGMKSGAAVEQLRKEAAEQESAANAVA